MSGHIALKYQNLPESSITFHCQFFEHFALLHSGLSALQGGPLMPQLDQLTKGEDTEAKNQVIAGLQRTGIYQVRQQ